MKNILYFTKRIHSFAGKILYFNLIGMVLISLFEGVGIFLLIPLISLSGIVDVTLEEDPLFLRLINIFQGIPENISLSLVLVNLCFINDRSMLYFNVIK